MVLHCDYIFVVTALLTCTNSVIMIDRIRLEWKTFSVIDYCIFWHLK